MKNSVFEYRDFRRYLRDWLGSQPKLGRGLRTQIADHLSCQPSFVSQIFSEKNNLSAEQAELLNGFLGHSSVESEYFLLLVLRDRAGSEILAKRYEVRIEEIQKARAAQIIKENYQTEITDEAKSIYYSRWFYAAIYAVAGSKKFQNANQIALKLGLPEEVVKEAINFLTRIGVVRKNQGRIQSGTKSIFLEPGSPHIKNLHLTWRVRAMEVMDKKKPTDMNYSMVFGLKKDQVLALRNSLSELVAKMVKELTHTPSEDTEMLYALNMDFFEV